jgi:hypothetical protein
MSSAHEELSGLQQFCPWHVYPNVEQQSLAPRHGVWLPPQVPVPLLAHAPVTQTSPEQQSPSTTQELEAAPQQVPPLHAYEWQQLPGGLHEVWDSPHEPVSGCAVSGAFESVCGVELSGVGGTAESPPARTSARFGGAASQSSPQPGPPAPSSLALPSVAPSSAVICEVPAVHPPDCVTHTRSANAYP